jgi:hypothetical protein
MSTEMSAAIYVLAPANPKHKGPDHANQQESDAVKYGILAHINSDLVALIAALRAMEAAGVELVVCAGNVLQRPSNVNHCADILREWGFPTALGAFDAVACGRNGPEDLEPMAHAHATEIRQVLSDKNRIWMEGLPNGLLFDDFAIVHGSPGASRSHRVCWKRLSEHWPFPIQSQGKICFVAHPDKPGIFAPKGELSIGDDGECILDNETNIFIAPGCLARRRFREPWSTFGILDTETRSYQQRALWAR